MRERRRRQQVERRRHPQPAGVRAVRRVEPVVAVVAAAAVMLGHLRPILELRT